MAWFKKTDDGEPQIMDANSNGRAGQETMTPRPEPREPRAEPRTPMPRAAEPAQRAPEAKPAQRTPEAKPAEPRPIEARAPESRGAETAPRVSVLGPTLRFRGELSAQEDLIVQGSVEGSITHTQSLTIGADGSMKGDIRARIIIVDGTVDGNLYATEFVNIRATAKVKGHVFAPRVAITEGAFFQGQIDMQPSGAAVQEHSARLRQATLAAPALEEVAVDRVLSGT